MNNICLILINISMYHFNIIYFSYSRKAGGPIFSGSFLWPDWIKIKRLIGITGPAGSEM